MNKGKELSGPFSTSLSKLAYLASKKNLLADVELYLYKILAPLAKL